jgi:GTPase involved in cell partitioning and DNA repair
MTKEQIDPVYKYVDNKVKSIKRELRQLKQTLLIAQQMIASSKVNTDANVFHSIVVTELKNKTHISSELLANAASVKAQIGSSEKPIDLAVGFYQKWSERLRELGAHTVEF